MKIYLASSWRNEQQQSIVAALRAAGHEVYDFKNPTAGDKGFGWSEIDPNWKNWSAADQIRCYEHPAAVRGLKCDFDAMRWADAFVMVQPCGRSAALELGWAIGAGKKTRVLMVDGQEPELMIRLADKLALSVEEVLVWLGETLVPPVRQSCGCDGALDDGCYNCTPSRWACEKCGFPVVRVLGVRDSEKKCLYCVGERRTEEEWHEISFCGNDVR